jgi:hypothetical protein
MLIAYASAIFFALVLYGLLVLRGLPSAVSMTPRLMGFVLLCFACVKVTFWLANRWELDPVQLGVAWAVALLLIVAIEGFRVLRKGQSAA